MFPTLGLFAAVRCPDLSASNPGGSCKRNPCLFSHSAPAQRLGSNAPSASAAASPRKRANEDAIEPKAAVNGDERATKLAKHTVNGGSGARPVGALFAGKDDADEEDVKPSAVIPRTATVPAAGTSRIGAPRNAAVSRTSNMVITGSGKVIRKGPAPALQHQSPSSGSIYSSSATSTMSAKGKGRATDFSSDTVHVRSSPAALANTPGLGPPRLPLNTAASYFPVATRNSMLKALYGEFTKVYGNLSGQHKHALAAEHALAQESAIYSKNNKFSYRNACIAIVARLKKRPPAERREETGTMEEYEKYLKEIEEADRTRLTVEKARQLTMTREDLIAYDYIVDMPEGAGGNIPTEEGGIKKCEKCAIEYIVHGNMTDAEKSACLYHWGRQERQADRSRRWACCQQPSDHAGCTRGPHAFSEKIAQDLHKRVAFLHSAALPRPLDAQPLPIAALDCEMVYTTAGMTLARVTIVDGEGTMRLDEFIRPNGMVIDLVTRWSGVTEEDLEGKARMDIHQLQRKVLGKVIDHSTILIGHGLENDLKALRLIHPAGRIIDTAHLFPHPRGLPYRIALRMLVQDHLGKFIQEAGAEGHSSLIDSRAALDLVKAKAAKMTGKSALKAEPT